HESLLFVSGDQRPQVRLAAVRPRVVLPRVVAGFAGLRYRWNVHRGLPERTSNAWTFPGAASLCVGRSDIDPPIPVPTMTTSRHTWGTPVQAYLVARGPRPGRKFTRPLSPNEVSSFPVRGSSAMRYSPRTRNRRRSAPSVQYVTPRVLSPRSPCPGSSRNGSCTQIVLPVPG